MKHSFFVALLIFIGCSAAATAVLIWEFQ